ncbi:MAG TPA: dTDP-4-dehydrorhamnose reductase [Tepidisphaeraceae bacterium]|jgi:dTDP-4-dehydrorhamnose reductase|nr:dTDP-4-dehydrorhamnose reductase [Tepidisphaeraceae bacterium]
MIQSIVIIGAKGMLAHALFRNLQSRGQTAHGVDLPECDITNQSSMAELFKTRRPTLVFNCAAHTKVDLCEEQEELANAINGHAVGAIAKLCREYGTYLVHFSTDFVFDGHGTRPYRATDAAGPLSAYGRSKLLGEQLLRQNAPEQWIIARTAWLYGLNGPNFPKTIVDRARANQPLKVVNDQVGSPTYTDDLAAATLDLLERNQSGIWHLTNTGQVSWFEFAKATLEAFDIKFDVAQTTSAEWFKMRPKSAIRPAYSVLDTEPFARCVGRPMRPWQDALRDYAVASQAK